MFLKEPELNFVEFTNNGNLPQGQYGSHSWMNAEVHAYPALRGDNYERFIDEHNQNFPLPSIRSDDVEMRSAPEIDDRGREVFLPYQDNSIDIDNNTRNSISEHINDFMKYEIKYGLERQIQNSQDPSPYVDNCGNPEAYFGSDIVTNISQSCYDCQTDEALFNYDETERSCSSADITPHDDDEQMFEASDSDESYIHDSEDHPLPRGIHNPNYPGFQHLAYTLQDYPLDSPNSYENSIFSNVDIICPTQTDLARSPAIKKPNIFEEYNNNIENTDTIHENNDNDDIYDKSEAKSEILENIVNIRRSQVIKIPTISHARGRPQRSYEDDDADFPNGDLSPMSHVSHVSTDIFVYSDGAESRDINLNQENPKPASAYTETLNYPEESEVSDFEDDIIALQRDIYEEIQKPLANTIENISDVVNNVIKCIVEHQYAIEDDNLKQYTNTISSNLYCRNQEKDKSENSDYESNISGNSSDSEGTPLETFSDNILNMDDAYMSNVKEDLFSSQSSESYTGSSTACEEEMSSSFEVFRDENSIPIEYDTDKNCNIHEPDSTSSGKNKVKTVDGVDIQSNNEHEVCPASQKKQEIDNRNSLPHLYSQKKQYISRKDDEKESDISGKPHKKKTASSAGFDVYNIETAMPLIDLDAIENHLRAAREEERRRRNDREEIRRRLAMGAELDDSYGFGDRPGRKPSLQARLQSGMNLQICFMNETASDAESPSETEMGEDCSPEGNSEIINDKCKELSSMNIDTNIPTFKLDETNNKKVNKAGLTRPSSLALNDAARPALISSLTTQAAFFECQARLQTEARMALAQAKEMAHMQMEIERQKQENSPITEMLRCSLLKAGVQLTGDRRRVSRQMLTDMNVAQLQVIVNELHTQIEFLNESLVKLLIARDELHMGQDSMLVDIEDLTRHLSAKEISSKSSGPSGDTPSPSGPLKSHLSTLTSLLSK